tara:strand:+ start:5159 stop:5467 length:309 start_codon:yes stop_codon:yes gene_type:complete
MSCPGHKKKEKRNYKCENEHYGSRPKQKKRRADRNHARKKAIKEGRVRKGDKDMDVHHTQPNGDLRKSPVVVISASVNRAMSAPDNLKKMRKKVSKKLSRKA